MPGAREKGKMEIIIQQVEFQLESEKFPEMGGGDG